MANLSDWSGKKVGILGLGRTGLSTAVYLKNLGADIFLSDKVSESEANQASLQKLKNLGIKYELGGHSPEFLSHGDMVVVSPGIPPSSEIIAQLMKMNKAVVCDLEIAAAETSIPIIAITGTNGKSTTCALISHILTQAGYKAPSCGNFGVPVFDVLSQKPDFLVMEVSSYQAYYSSRFAPTIAIWLNLTPDHLEWHGDLAEYIHAKEKLFANQKKDQYAILNIDDPIVAKFKSTATVFPISVKGQITQDGAFFKNNTLSARIGGKTYELCQDNQLTILGLHNIENALAAISAALLLKVPEKEITAALKSFPGLEHRLEFVAEIDGVRFYNDSKATNPTSVIVALESFDKEKIVLIAGGKDKGTALNEFVDSIKEHVSEVILLGEAKERFAQALNQSGYTNVHFVNNLAEAVDLGHKLKKGPVVLSPACASFDMFANYEERGRVFKDTVQSRLAKAPSR